eukprot:1825231-Pleurochrysis_carterae.AAC.1
MFDAVDCTGDGRIQLDEFTKASPKLEKCVFFTPACARMRLCADLYLSACVCLRSHGRRRAC